VGNYAIVPSATGTNLADYTVTPVSGSLTVSSAALTITANNATRSYGSANPAFGGAVSGQVNGDTFTVTASTTATAASPVGNYAIVPSATGSNLSNYTVNAVSGSLTVSSAALTITANNATRSYGSANPSFSATVSGQVNGNTFTVTAATAATAASPVGSYAIVPSAAGPNLADYTQTVTDGTLTITQAGTMTTINVNDATVATGASATLSVQVASATSGTPTGTVSFYDGTSLLSTVALTGGAASYTTSSLAAGATHSLTAVYGGDTNFSASTSKAAAIVTIPAQEFSLSTSSSTQSSSVVPGGVANYSFALAPLAGVYPGAVAFSVSGLPPGATATFSPTSLAANAGPQTITMTVQTAATTASQLSPSIGRRLAPGALALLLMPLFGAGRMRRRGRRLGSYLSLLLLAGIATATLLTGCRSWSGFFAQAPTSYPLTITATSGGLQHTVSVTLNEQ
jgi:hypothetical protein